MDTIMLRRTLTPALIGIACLTITGCATQKNPHVDDPFEGLNRATFGFNKAVDTVVVKPVSYAYLKYLPQPIQVGIGNFFDNIREVTNIANDVLQLKFKYATHDLSRLLINTTVGIGGLFDPAASLGLEHRKEDFGQTLYYWGYKHSYYIVLPFIGPSTFRDTIGLGVDFYALSIWPWIDQGWEKYTLLGLDYLDLRARLLRRESVLDALAVDEYAFMRDAYFQHRKYLSEESSAANESNGDIYDGISPEEMGSKTVTTMEPTTAPAESTTPAVESKAPITTSDTTKGNEVAPDALSKKTSHAQDKAKVKAANTTEKAQTKALQVKEDPKTSKVENKKEKAIEKAPTKAGTI